MAKLKFDFKWAIVGAIIGFIFFSLLDATAILGTINNLPTIGTLFGLLAGGFKEEFDFF